MNQQTKKLFEMYQSRSNPLASLQDTRIISFDQ